ncbi:MAG: DNA polymerase IV [Anaerovoracaceae bacterium]|jgi:DNA polymerase-4
MLVFHVDANTAYLSWTAAALLDRGYGTDLRSIPSAIAGDPENRHGIILTKSIPAKKMGIKTGESIFEAKQKCPDLVIYPPDYDLFMLCSDAMYSILSQYSSLVQRYSVDECFLDMTHSAAYRDDPLGTAHEIRERIKDELGFTVNVGIGENKLLAKMASELKKPDRVHTIWRKEIPQKMWPLPVKELFMVGRASDRKLRYYGIDTIGMLANTDPSFLRGIMRSHGQLVYEYANGIDYSPVVPNEEIIQKGVGNSLTFAYDLLTKKEIYSEALALCERVAMRLRRLRRRASLISVSMRSSELYYCRHQVQLQSYLNTATEMYAAARMLIDEMWQGQPVRQMGVHVSNFAPPDEIQLSMFDMKDREYQESLEHTVDDIRRKYGTRSVFRGTFANSGIDPIQGGVNDGSYLMMGGYRNEDIG